MWRGGLKGWDETRTERQWCCTGMTNSWGIFPACSFGKPRQYCQQTPVSQHHVSWRFIPPLMGWFLNKNYCEVHAFSFKSWHLNMDVCNFFHRSLVIQLRFTEVKRSGLSFPGITLFGTLILSTKHEFCFILFSKGILSVSKTTQRSEVHHYQHFSQWFSSFVSAAVKRWMWGKEDRSWE